MHNLHKILKGISSKREEKQWTMMFCLLSLDEQGISGQRNSKEQFI